MFRYDGAVMRPATSLHEGKSVQLVRKLDSVLPTNIEWRLGLRALIDNWRMLHARARQPSEPEPDRTLERVLISNTEV